MTAHLASAWRGLRAAPRRSALAALGILLASAMAGAAVTVAYGLATGFDRAARAADLPDVLVRFRDQPRSRIDDIVRNLPDLAARAYRLEFTGVDLAAGFDESDHGVVQAVSGPRRGYAIVAGRDVDGRAREAVVERGLAGAWHLRPGSEIDVGSLGPLRVAGVAVSPDNVAFPLASAPRVYVSEQWLQRDLAAGQLPVNQALIWARNPRNVDVLLQQARATSAPIPDVRFITRDGVRVLIDGAAGVVIALLVAFSVIALGAAAVMLGAGARADVARRLGVIGVQRAIGIPRAAVAGERAAAAGAVALVAGGLGVAGGALLAGGPAGDLLRALNELPPGTALVPPLLAALAGIVALVAAASAWPAWRAAGQPPVLLLRGGELAGRPPRRRVREAARALPLALGARLAAARRARTGATIAVLAVSGAVILLMLGLASLVAHLRDDPGSVGKRYALSAQLPARATPAVRALPGVAAAAPRYVVSGADSFALGEPVKLIAFPGDHTAFEDPPLAEGRRVRADDEAEVGLGLAQALGLRVGGTLATQLPSGGEVRFRVVGIVRSLDSEGRVAYVRPRRVLAAAPGLQPEIAIRLSPGADRAAVQRRLQTLGAAPSAVGGATTRDGGFLDVLASLLRAVAGLDALVCVYALVQAVALTAGERRPTLSLLRATGAGARTIAAVLAGATLVITVPAALAAVALERWVLAPAVGRLAAGYADLSPALSAGRTALVALGLVVAGLVAAAWVARRVVREPPVAGLREE